VGKQVVGSAKVQSAARERFYDLIGQVPETEAAWAERQATLRNFRSDPHFQPYWHVIDQMLTVDFSSFKRRASVAGTPAGLEGYDFDAWREQRDYDVKHDRLP